MMKIIQKKCMDTERLMRSRTGAGKTPVPAVGPVSAPTAGRGLLQRKSICACDGGCPRCAPAIQPKLTVGSPDDAYEEEADRVADRVMRMPEPEMQRKPS